MEGRLCLLWASVEGRLCLLRTSINVYGHLWKADCALYGRHWLTHRQIDRQAGCLSNCDWGIPWSQFVTVEPLMLKWDWEGRRLARTPLSQSVTGGDPLKSVLNPSSQNGTEKGSHLARTPLNSIVSSQCDCWEVTFWLPGSHIVT